MKAIMDYFRKRSRKFKSSAWLDPEQITFTLKDEDYRLADDYGVLYLFRESEDRTELVKRFDNERECYEYFANI